MITSYSYDAAGRTIATRRDMGAMTTISTEYDNLGRTIATTDVLGRVTRTEYSERPYHHGYHSGRGYLVSNLRRHNHLTRRNRAKRDGDPAGTNRRGILTTTLSKGVVLSRSLKNGFGQTVRQEQPNTKEGSSSPVIHTMTRDN
ncbi:MAG: hypothetical protein ACLT8E_01285 [Akkermansia sp.]